MAMSEVESSTATLAALEEHKLRLYAAIRELGFDYRTDKLEEADYEEEVERIKAEAVVVVRQISELRSQAPRAAGGIDLLTLTLHEMGHILGLPDLVPQGSPDALMSATLSTGVRKAVPDWDPTAPIPTASVDGTLEGETDQDKLADGLRDPVLICPRAKRPWRPKR